MMKQFIFIGGEEESAVKLRKSEKKIWTLTVSCQIILKEKCDQAFVTYTERFAVIKQQTGP